jgi:hypothetical protein
MRVASAARDALEAGAALEVRAADALVGDDLACRARGDDGGRQLGDLGCCVETRA